MTPYIQALIAMTGDKLQQRMQKDPTAASDSLLFMGNQHDTVPRRLLQDPLLSPRDKFAWQVIRMQTQDNGGAVFPSYRELQVQLSNRPQDEKASRSTVSRSLLMLRLTRWLSLCHKARDRVSGRILGNVYALHDEPLSVLDAMRFDASYLHLLEQCSRHETNPSAPLRKAFCTTFVRTPNCAIYRHVSNCWKNEPAGSRVSLLRKLSQKRPVSIRYQTKFHLVPNRD
ncbi:hypothetical protein ML119_001282 [Klebsiella variicola]|nr:hypothetical protein [Klebsiella variicola]